MGATHSTAANERAGAQLWEAVETRDCAMLEQLLKEAPRCALHSRPHDQFSVLHQGPNSPVLTTAFAVPCLSDPGPALLLAMQQQQAAVRCLLASWLRLLAHLKTLDANQIRSCCTPQGTATLAP